ncbi:cystatin-like protein [Drosophila ficusphila]|uniref:cystatin-like protein n=1 Tax=Drosophila ficusphila TaxID=30025 RepID=UPI0007E7DA46|nr:cystatin-like protein [Drosophila ficusphila]
MSVDHIVGGIKQLEGNEKKEALELLDSTFSQLASREGTPYKVVKVTSVTGQVVAGTLNTYEVELDNGSEVKQCHVEIWTQIWLKENGTNIKIKFAGEDVELDRTW